MANSWWVLKPSHFFIIFSISFILTNETATIYAKSNTLFQRDAIHHRLFTQKLSEQRQRIRLSNVAATNTRKILQETANENEEKLSGLSSSSVSVEMRIRSAADKGVGQYVVAFKAGTPSQKFELFVDTGSDLTWLNCKYGCKNINTEVNNNKCSARTSRNRRVFLADASSSFNRVLCSSDMCKLQLADLFSLALCPSPLTPCAYDYRYSDGSFSQGIFANETVTLDLTNGRKMKVHNVLIGCSDSYGGPSFQDQAAADGVLGLGFSNSSFALRATNQFGGKFSYCLVDHLSHRNVSSYLIFGPSAHKSSIGGTTRYTTLGAINTFYAVNVQGISIDGVMLDIPKEIWNVEGVGGTIVNSGSSLTYLTTPAYEPVVATLKVSLQKFRQVNVTIEPLKYCFDSTGFDEVDSPKLVFHLDDGARFEPPVKSYVIDAAKGVKCLGFVSTAWPGVSVIGNIMQQNYLWEYDLIKGKLGFSPSSCT